jgi:hypothetical protein
MIVVINKKIAIFVIIAVVLVLIAGFIFLGRTKAKVASSYNVVAPEPIRRGNEDSKYIAFACNVDWGNEVLPDILKTLNDEKIKMEKEYEYNWITILSSWELLDDTKEGVKKQDGRTASRLAFLNITKNFLEEQGLINDIGNDEIELTEKAKIIMQRYYMDYEFNRGILNFMYGLESDENMGV